MKELKMNGLVQVIRFVYRMDSSLGSIPVAFNMTGSFLQKFFCGRQNTVRSAWTVCKDEDYMIRSSILEGDAEVSPYELGKRMRVLLSVYDGMRIRSQAVRI